MEKNILYQEWIDYLHKNLKKGYILVFLDSEMGITSSNGFSFYELECIQEELQSIYNNQNKDDLEFYSSWCKLMGKETSFILLKTNIYNDGEIEFDIDSECKLKNQITRNLEEVR